MSAEKGKLDHQNSVLENKSGFLFNWKKEENHENFPFWVKFTI